MKAATVKQVVIYGILTVAAILWALPIWWAVINASKSSSDFFAHPFYAIPREFDLLSNIRSAWDAAGLGQGFINSLIYGVVGAAASIVIASLAAYGIVVLRIKGGFTIFMMIYSGTVFPLQMYIIPLFRMYNSVHIYNTRWGLLLFYTAISVPFCTLVLRGFYSTVPGEYREAALVEGAGEARILRSVYAPLSVSAALVLFLFQFTWIWNDLLFGIVLASSPSVHPVMASLSSLMGVYGGSSLPVELSGALIAASPMLVLFFTLRRFFTQGLSLIVRR
ncbi:MAG TPA: carbohydrate ABC transporter permease [Acidimicrobiales bacterium]|nr:carbohydrate ABC transporter permease [Acidimicrobiales bacterium]